MELPRLLLAAEYLIADQDSDEDLRLPLAPGSSLGGARSKASVRDGDGRLLIAKFPNKAEEGNTVAWEAAAFALASKGGIPVSPWRMETIGTVTSVELRTRTKPWTDGRWVRRSYPLHALLNKRFPNARNWE